VFNVGCVFMVCIVELCCNRVTLCFNAVIILTQIQDGHPSASSVSREINKYTKHVYLCK
jgi:hypothetical protein